MSDDNWFWQVSKMTYFKRLDRLMVGKSKLDLCQDYVGSCICIINMDWQGTQKNSFKIQNAYRTQSFQSLQYLTHPEGKRVRNI